MRGKDLAGIRMSRGGPPGRVQGRLPASALALALTLPLLCGAAGRAVAVSRIDRPGVYALGVWGQYGFVEGKSRYGLDFDKGAGYSLHFRYNTGRHTALTVYFDNQTFDAISDSSAVLQDVRMTAVHAGLRFFSIPTGDVLRYAEVTVGFYRPEIRRPRTIAQSIGEDVSFPGEGFMAHAGAGLEIFFTPTWAVELGAHGYLLKGRGLTKADVYNGEEDLTVTGQVVGGITYYLLR